ncbi:Histone-lysine N-methyltransferase [Bertholletia excelsa]
MMSGPDGGSCDGSLKRRHLEKGFCNSSGVILKKRKVYAVRDFPPGCGRNSPPINPVPRLNETLRFLGDKGNLADSEKKLNVTECDCVKDTESRNETLSKCLTRSPSKWETLEASDNLVGIDATVAGKVSESALLKASENNVPEWSESKALQLSGELPELEVEGAMKSGSTPENRAILEVPFEARGMVPAGDTTSQCPTGNANCVKEIVQKNRYRRRKVSATRDFPPFCGRNTPCLSKEELLCAVLGKRLLEAIKGRKLREVMNEEGSSVTETERTVIEVLDKVVEEYANEIELEGIIQNEDYLSGSSSASGAIDGAGEG